MHLFNPTDPSLTHDFYSIPLRPTYDFVPYKDAIAAGASLQLMKWPRSVAIASGKTRRG